MPTREDGRGPIVPLPCRTLAGPWNPNRDEDGNARAPPASEMRRAPSDGRDMPEARLLSMRADSNCAMLLGTSLERRVTRRQFHVQVPAFAWMQAANWTFASLVCARPSLFHLLSARCTLLQSVSKCVCVCIYIDAALWGRRGSLCSCAIDAHVCDGVELDGGLETSA